MRVITLDKHGFAEACKALEQQSRGFAPDLVVGIQHGGAEVSRAIFGEVAHAEVKCQRATTAGKRKAERLFAVVRRLPLWMRDALRVAEACWLKRRKAVPEKVCLQEDVAGKVRNAERILVVDDAIDSGATVRAVLNALEEVDGHRDVAVAVIAVTTRDPIVNAEFALYRGDTLVRFPWSMDA